MKGLDPYLAVIYILALPVHHSLAEENSAYEACKAISKLAQASSISELWN